MQKIIGNTQELITIVPKKAAEENKGKMETLKEYVRNGGIIRTVITEDSFPLIIYPTKKMLEGRIKEKEEILATIQKRRNDWNKRFIKAKTYNFVNSLKKFYSPIYWKHLAKSLTNTEYREHSKKVELPVELTSDKKWMPMIKMFVEDDEYRRQLVETVENSVIYKKGRKLGLHAKKINEFRTTESEKNLQEVQKKLEAMQKEVRILKEMNVLVK